MQINFLKRIVAALVLFKSGDIYYLPGSDVKSSRLSPVGGVTVKIADNRRS